MTLRPLLCAAALSLLATTPAHAQPTQTVLIPARPLPVPRDDVRAACPGLADTLAQELAPAVRMHGRAGTVQVEFGVRDGQVHEVVARGGPGPYRQPIRRALLAQPCDIGRGASRFRVAVRLEPQPADAPAHRVAQLLTP